MNGWIETQEQIDERWSHRTFEAMKITYWLDHTTEADADKLHDLLTNPIYDADGKIVTVTKSAWQIEAEALAEDYVEDAAMRNDLYNIGMGA